MLVMANQHSLLAYTCCLVAALSVREPLIPLYSIRGENPQQTQTLMLESLKQRFSFCPLGQARNFGDLAVLMRVVLAAEAAKILTASLTDNIARRVDPVTVENAPKGAYECQKLKDCVYIDPSSVLYKGEPDWVLYQEIIERKDKKCMQNVMSVEESWLPRLASSYCCFTPIKDAEPR
ncbi:unnamed protein product [Gongylonema pulchrum]|uniref:OB_NTP_bind domain-containing protein n=1 Tax=Gongylonema pulchrum TaxID=637853 RepID=A0A183EDS5_9BILA|nr:unnamed protein product [Gongylonema pulchrum]